MFNRPQSRNAMTFAMYEELYAHCDDIDADDEIRVLVLRGAGGRAFVSGTDIRQFLDFDSGKTGVEYEEDIDRYLAHVEIDRVPDFNVAPFELEKHRRDGTRTPVAPLLTRIVSTQPPK